MAFVSVTRLRLRSIRHLPDFALHASRSLRQLRAAPGFRGGGLLAEPRLAFWTITAWDGADGLCAYTGGGAHRAAMPSLLHWCDEASVVHWTQHGDALPSWSEADRRMRSEGRPSKLRHPGPHHADLSFHRSRASVSAPIRSRNA